MSSDDNDDQQSSAFNKAKAAAREEYKTMTLFSMVEHMKLLRSEKDDLEAQLAIVNAKFDVLRTEVIPAKMDDDGIERITFDGIGRVGLTADMLVSATDKAGLFAWLHENGFQDLIQPTINASTLKAFVKNRMKEGKPVPEEYLRVIPFTRASITKVK